MSLPFPRIARVRSHIFFSLSRSARLSLWLTNYFALINRYQDESKYSSVKSSSNANPRLRLFITLLLSSWTLRCNSIVHNQDVYLRSSSLFDACLAYTVILDVGAESNEARTGANEYFRIDASIPRVLLTGARLKTPSCRIQFAEPSRNVYASLKIAGRKAPWAVHLDWSICAKCSEESHHEFSLGSFRVSLDSVYRQRLEKT